jgi:hypothetical protein
MTRAPYFKPRAKFTPAEDDQLRALVAAHGTNNWAAISEKMPGKNVRQCKERWTNYLAPVLNVSTWTCEEDFFLLQKYAEFGSKWVQIASFFPNRTDSMIKNRFNQLQRREQKRRELLLRGEFAFALPLLQSALAAMPPRSAPVIRSPEPVAKPQEAPLLVFPEGDEENEFETDLWGDPSGFPEDMFAF